MRTKLTLFFILLLINPAICLAQMPRSKGDPAIEFTVLAIVSSVIIVALWLMLWLKNRKKKH